MGLGSWLYWGILGQVIVNDGGACHSRSSSRMKINIVVVVVGHVVSRG